LWRAGLAVTLVCLLGSATSAFAAKPSRHAKLDRKLNDRASMGGSSRVIVLMKPGWTADSEATKLGGRLGRRLGLINGRVLELSNTQLRKLADYPGVARIVHDRPIGGEMNRVALTVGAREVQQNMGFTGAGVGVAVIDSGVAGWHNDLSYQGLSSLVQTSGGQRVARFVDFVGGLTTSYDDNGHGTHVSGIIAGNGYDTRGARAGIAPDAHLVSLRVLDQHSHGVISNVIAALDWAVENKALYNIRVINLSVGAAVTESYNTDPLTLAAKRAVDAGIVVVTAAGNFGKNSRGQTQYGAITAPGNAPWVLTVGASSHQGTVDRADDVMAGYSSRGPSAIDFQAKPDVVAPGTGSVSLSSPGSYLYLTKPLYLLTGSRNPITRPYLSLSGTSMAAPVVAGSIALMLQANPDLTPNLVKAIIQYTAQSYSGYNALTAGAGFLNTKGAVELARYFRTAQPGDPYPSDALWSKTIIWGNHRLRHGVIQPTGNAWGLNVPWGAAADGRGTNIVWGTNQTCEPGVECDNIVWGTSIEDCRSGEQCDNVVWGTASDDGDNVVWGTDCNGADCDNVIWGATPTCGPGEECDNIVWGTADECRPDEECDNVVWGTSASECEAGEECDNIVWGTSLACESEECDNIVWGTLPGRTAVAGDPCQPGEECDNIVWGTGAGKLPFLSNSCAGEECDNIVWGTAPVLTAGKPETIPPPSPPPPPAAPPEEQQTKTPAGLGISLGKR
jgi:serine protease AprX